MSYTLTGDTHNLDNILRDIGILQKLACEEVARQKLQGNFKNVQLGLTGTPEIFEKLISYQDILKFAEVHGIPKSAVTRLWNHVGFYGLETSHGAMELQRELVPLGKFASLSESQALRIPLVSRGTVDLLARFLAHFDLKLGEAKEWFENRYS